MDVVQIGAKGVKKIFGAGTAIGRAWRGRADRRRTRGERLMRLVLERSGDAAQAEPASNRIGTFAISEHHARSIITKATGERPRSVEVEPGPNVLTIVFRAVTESGPRCYLFDGDGDTPSYEWGTLLREICWQEGCWDAIVPSSSAAAWRSCARHTTQPLASQTDPG